MKCCWNGLVAMDAGPFVAGGEVGAGRREWRRREREERESKRGKRGGAELDGDDGIIPTFSSVPAPSFPPLRFRAAGKGECAASECSLLCNDLLRRGAEGLELEAAGAEREERGGDRREEEDKSPLLSLPPPPSSSGTRPLPAFSSTRASASRTPCATQRTSARGTGSAASRPRDWADVSKAPAVDWGDDQPALLFASPPFSPPRLLPSSPASSPSPVPPPPRSLSGRHSGRPGLGGLLPQAGRGRHRLVRGLRVGLVARTLFFFLFEFFDLFFFFFEFVFFFFFGFFFAAVELRCRRSSWERRRQEEAEAGSSSTSA